MNKEDKAQEWAECGNKINRIYFDFCEKESITTKDCCAAASTVAETYLAIAIRAGADLDFIVSETKKQVEKLK